MYVSILIRSTLHPLINEWNFVVVHRLLLHIGLLQSGQCPEVSGCKSVQASFACITDLGQCVDEESDCRSCMHGMWV